MNKRWRWIVAMAMAVSTTASSASAEEGLIVGAEAGAAVPVSSFKSRADNGGMASLFAGYMFNDYLGLVGDAEYTGFYGVDRPRRIDDGPQVLGFHAGPRVALPFYLGELPTELYLTWRGGVDTGLVGNTPLNSTSFAHAVGAGLNFRLNHALLLGIFGRYNWVDQRVEPGRSIEYVTTGVALTYNAAEPPPPPPAPEEIVEPEPPPVKKKIVLRGVHFDFDQAKIRSDARPVLDEAIRTLSAEDGIAVVAEGHTDSRGDDDYNQKLSEQRARAVHDYLVQGGIAPSRISFEGYGETRPVATNDNDSGRGQNRRVELRIRNGE